MEHCKKQKIKKAMKIAGVAITEFAKSFAFGYCLAAGVGITAIAIKAKHDDAHLEWVPNK